MKMIEEQLTKIKEEVKTLLQLIKDNRETITLKEAGDYTSKLRELTSWLLSCQKFLLPEKQYDKGGE